MVDLNKHMKDITAASELARMCGALCRERKAHVPEPFWKIVMKHGHASKLTEFHWARGRLFDHHVAAMLYEMCLQEPQATVTKVCFCSLDHAVAHVGTPLGRYVRN